MLARSSLLVALVAALTFLLTASPAAAEVTWRSTGVEYVKRFAAPSGINRCYYQCPSTYPGTSYMASSASGTDGTYQGQATTYCNYGSVFVCSYDVNSGALFAGNSGPNCPPQATQVCDGPVGDRRKRTLSPLEAKIRARQYKYVRKN